MRFWCPTGIGFLNHSPINMTAGHAAPKKQYMVIQDLAPGQDLKSKVLGKLGAVAQSAEGVLNVGSFWVLEREHKEDGDDVILFARFDCKDSYEAFVHTDAGRTWGTVSGLCESAQRKSVV